MDGVTSASDVASRSGRVAIVQSDNRYCDPIDSELGVRSWPYWWSSVMLNAQWARRHGYQHLTYCVLRCLATDGHGYAQVDLAPAWCKIPVLADVLQSKLHDSILYLDSDAFWNSSRSMAALQRYVWAGDWNGDAAGSVFFGCNLPWNGEDRGRRQWNRSWENGSRGPPNTGVMLLRGNARSLATLTAWWRAPFTMPRWNERHQWEQSALWEMWHTVPRFATPLRVLSDPTTGDCMRSMDRKRVSIVAHIPGGGRSVLKVREAFFTAAERQQRARATPWATVFVKLGGRALALPPVRTPSDRRCLQELQVAANAESVRLLPCTYEASTARLR